MKLLGIFILLILVQACDPLGFGYKKNPSHVLEKAYEAVMASDLNSFIKVSGKEALCIYGNDEGLNYLRNNLATDANDFEIKPKLLENSIQHLKAPRFVGFWAYYQEKYQIDILDKHSKAELLKVVIECNFGSINKNEIYQILKVQKYKQKECRVIKIVPFQFEALPLPQKCESLKVDLL